MKDTSFVRAKFKCESKLLSQDGATIKLVPVINGSEENKEFFNYTPCGSIEIGIVNDSCSNAFVPGKEYYVDFTLSNK